MNCKNCGKEFKPHGRDVTCSKECSLENRRQNKRRSYHRIGKFTDDRYLRTIRQRMRRIEKRLRSKYENKKTFR